MGTEAASGSVEVSEWEHAQREGADVALAAVRGSA